MGSPLADVVLGVVALVALIGMFGLLGSGNLYSRIGAGGTSIEGGEPSDSHAAALERDTEIRQMLLARSERLERSGQPPLDIEREAARLRNPAATLAPVPGTGTGTGTTSHIHGHDPELVQELHQLAEARNERRRRRGEPLLDVDAEVARKLAELDG